MMKSGINEFSNPEDILILIRNFNFLLSVIISGFVILAVYTFSLTASFHLANGEKNWKGAFKKAFSTFGNIYLISLIGIFISVIGFILFIIPGILVLFFLSFIYPIAIVEKTGIIETMKKSYSAIRANWKFVASRLILFGVVSMLVNAITGALRIGYLASDLSIIFLPIFYIIIYKEIKNK